jgi:hypothetical protein
MRKLFFEVHGSAIVEGNEGQEVFRSGLLPSLSAEKIVVPPCNHVISFSD